MSGHFKELFDVLNISYDRFIRTTDPITTARAGDLGGDGGRGLYLDRYEGWYSVRDEAYYDEANWSKARGGQASPQGTRSNGPRRKAGSSACPTTPNPCSNCSRRPVSWNR